MSYQGYINKHDWEDGEVIQEAFLDNIQEGLQEAGQEIVSLASSINLLQLSTSNLNTNINNLMASTFNLASSINTLNEQTNLLQSTIDEYQNIIGSLETGAITTVTNLNDQTPIQITLTTSSDVEFRQPSSIYKEENDLKIVNSSIHLGLSDDIISTLNNVSTLADNINTLASSVNSLNNLITNVGVPWIIGQAYESSTGKYYLSQSQLLSFNDIYNSLSVGKPIYVQGSSYKGINQYDPNSVSNIRTGLYPIISAYGQNTSNSYTVAALITGSIGNYGNINKLTSPALAIYETNDPMEGILYFKCVVEAKLNTTVCSTITDHSILGGSTHINSMLLEES